MSVLTREELMAQVKTHFGEATDDDSLKFIEDLSDTITSLEEKTNDTEDWKAKYEENDKAWREKYRERFFSGSENSDGSGVTTVEKKIEAEENAPKTFEELFK